MNYEQNEMLSAEDLYEPTTDTSEYDSFSQMWAEEEGSNNKPSDSMGLTEDEYEDNQGYDDEDDATSDLIEHSKGLEKRELEQNMENYESLAQNFEELPSDLKFNIAGSEFTREEIVKLVKTNEDIQKVSGDLVGFYTEMEQQKDFLRERAYAVALESDLRAIEIKKHLNDPYVDSNRKGQLYNELQTLTRQSELVNQRARQESERIDAVKIQTASKNIETIKTKMAQKYTDWDDVRQDYGQYLQSSGVDFKQLAPVLSPQLADVFMKAMKYDKSILKVEKETSKKLSQVPQRQRAVAPTSKVKQQVKQTNTDFLNRLKSGQADVDEWFNHLED